MFREDGTYEREDDTQEQFDLAYMVLLPQTLAPMEVNNMVLRAVNAAYAPDPYVKPLPRQDSTLVQPEPEPDSSKSLLWANAAEAAAVTPPARQHISLLRKLRYVARAMDPRWQL